MSRTAGSLVSRAAESTVLATDLRAATVRWIRACAAKGAASLFKLEMTVIRRSSRVTRARTLLLFLVAVVIWLPALHLFYGVDQAGRDAIADRLAARQSQASSSDSVDAMRRVNPEWDFMQRTYTVLALANRALVKPNERTRNLAAIDRIVDDTVKAAEREGDHSFMLPYAKAGRFRDTDARSLFIDGEIVAMIAARDMIEPRKETLPIALDRAARIEHTMRKSPSMSGESYPNECWTFCNTTALAGLVMLDRAHVTAPGARTDHASLVRDWVAFAKEHLVDPKTGLLVSSYTYDGRRLDGPEGSSIWMSAANLLVLDEAFARDQYARARKELGVSFLGFGWAREWPSGQEGRVDVDSGPIVPIVEASAGSSGLAFLGASAFGDDAWLAALFASVELTGFRDEATGRYRASNEVGDAVLLYALSFGPLWRKVKTPPSDFSVGFALAPSVRP